MTATETMLYRNWLRGALGSADTATAQKYGPVLYDAKSLSWGEAQDIANGDRPIGAGPLMPRGWPRVNGHVGTLIQPAGMVTMAPGAFWVRARARRICRTVKASLLSKSSSAIQNQVR